MTEVVAGLALFVSATWIMVSIIRAEERRFAAENPIEKT